MEFEFLRTSFFLTSLSLSLLIAPSLKAKSSPFLQGLHGLEENDEKNSILTHSFGRWQSIRKVRLKNLQFSKTKKIDQHIQLIKTICKTEKKECKTKEVSLKIGDTFSKDYWLVAILKEGVLIANKDQNLYWSNFMESPKAIPEKIQLVWRSPFMLAPHQSANYRSNSSNRKSKKTNNKKNKRYNTPPILEGLQKGPMPSQMLPKGRSNPRDLR